MIRIPREIDVPLTPRVRQIIDTPEFRRLTRISQLGLVSLVYPAANHSRFEHSLGTYRIALLYLKQLSGNARFREIASLRDVEIFLAATLLHDLGHWPFCHAIEDIQLPRVPQHELFANSFLLEGEIADALREDWNINPRDVVALLSEKPRTTKAKLFHSMLSGPIDVDKMDYLVRDSVHAGVPYGQNFDQQRLIGSLCLNANGDGLAITEKGRTAAEMMVFARYVMFSEVYWHHAVRAATAMLQRSFYLLHGQLTLDSLFRLSEHEMIDSMRAAAQGGPADELLDGLFGYRRRLYKRIAEFSYFQHQEQYLKLARRPYPWLVACSEELARSLSKRLGSRIAPHELLFDAPPMKLEVQFEADVLYSKENCYRPFEEVSPVIQTLARRQFDDYVKRVRLFCNPRVAEALRRENQLNQLLDEVIEQAVPE